MASPAVPIPTRKPTDLSSPAAQSSYSSSSSSSSYGSPVSGSHLPASSSQKRDKGKGKATGSLVGSPVGPLIGEGRREVIAPRRPSLLGSSLSKSEHTVINLAHSDCPPRLVTCVKSAQGFDWNQELFLPSHHTDRDSHDMEHKQEPVLEIHLTDEEAAAMLP